MKHLFRSAVAASALLLPVTALLTQTTTRGSSDTDGRVNVKNHGAKGDGIANDTSAIVAAIAALPEDGGTVVFPAGTYLISSTIAPAGPIRLLCEGSSGLNGSIHGSCQIKKSATLNGNALFFGPHTRGSIVEGFEIDGAPGNGGDGIQILSNSIVLRDVAVVNQGGNGIFIGEDVVRDGTQSNSFYLDRVRSANNRGHGFYLQKQNVAGPNLPDANAGTMINCVAQANGGDGIRIGKAIDNTFVGFLSEFNKGAGVRLLAGSGVETFVGGDLNENNEAGNVVIDAGAIGSYFLGIDTGTSVKDSSTFKSIFWNRNLGLTGGWTNPEAGGNLSVGAAMLQSGRGMAPEPCESGSLYLRTDGGPKATLYVCESRHWIAK